MEREEKKDPRRVLFNMATTQGMNAFMPSWCALSSKFDFSVD